MEISKEKLAILDTPAYSEYQKLLKRDAVVYKFTIAFYFLTGYAAYLGGVGLLYSFLLPFIERRIGGWAAPIAIVLIYLAFLGLAGIVVPLSASFEFLALRFRSRGRREAFRLRFEPVEREIESDAIQILSPIETEVLQRNKENISINNKLRLKRAWRSWYENDLKTVQKNCELNSSVVRIVVDNIRFVKFDTKKREDFARLRSKLSDPFREYRTLNTKLYSLYGRPDSIKLDVPDWIRNYVHVYSPPTSAGRSPRVSDKPSRASDSSKPLGLEVPLTPTVNKTETPTVAVDSSERLRPSLYPFTKPVTSRISPADILGIQPDTELEGGNGVANKLTLESITPPSDENPADDYKPSGRIIKASPEYYQKVASRNMEIGMKGELCVLEYEGHRVFNEEGKAYLAKLDHVSVNQGDGLGYDILSIENNRKIYIEVKTTKGDADAILYFSSRELAAMEEFGEQYYLYRVYEFDEVNGGGKLNIYKGKEEITANYSMRPKEWMFIKR